MREAGGEGVRCRNEELEAFSPGFYVDDVGAKYFCVSKFLLAYALPFEIEFVRLVLDQVMREFPGIAVIEFAEPELAIASRGDG